MIAVSKRVLLVSLAAIAMSGLTVPASAADATDLAAAKTKARFPGRGPPRSRRPTVSPKLFEDKTGIKVEMFRSGGTAILRRFMQEYDA